MWNIFHGNAKFFCSPFNAAVCRHMDLFEPLRARKQVEEEPLATHKKLVPSAVHQVTVE